MIKICKHNQENVLRKIYNNEFDNVAISTTNFIDDIILTMKDNEILDCLSEGIKDKRADNTTIPFDLFLIPAIAAKMKVHTSFTDIPLAITDHRVLAKLGYNLIDTDGDLKTGLMRESSIRALLGKYEDEELFLAYNNTVQNYIMPKLDIIPNIHILDCTELSVNLKNDRYEKSAVTKNKDGDTDRGYKLSTLRGLVDDSGIIEEICFGAMNVHDMELSREMLKTTKVFKPGDILINDRGFINRDMMNFLKTERKVDTYVPLKTNMTAYSTAVMAAQSENKWEAHPTRENQKISFVTDLGSLWESSNIKNDVAINAAVVWDLETDSYFVFVTTDISVTAKQIILTYELRPEIEEDYRQLKEYWKLEDFKSTKSTMIAFHIMTVLFGYLFFQIYTMLPEGEQYSHKCLPVVLKNYQSKALPCLIFYADAEFGILSIIEFAELYSLCDDLIKEKLKYVFSLH